MKIGRATRHLNWLKYEMSPNQQGYDILYLFDLLPATMQFQYDF